MVAVDKFESSRSQRLYLNRDQQVLLAGGGILSVMNLLLCLLLQCQPTAITPLKFHAQTPRFLVPPPCRCMPVASRSITSMSPSQTSCAHASRHEGQPHATTTDRLMYTFHTHSVHADLFAHCRTC